MSSLPTVIQTDRWVKATWDEFLHIVEDPAFTKAKSYYYNGEMRLDTMGVGPDHASDNTIVLFAINLFCTLRSIPLKGLINASYRKTGVREAQPDISYYLRERVPLAPQGRSSANLDIVPPPDLAIEIADSSLDDDIGKKRLLYEDLQVPEYWVVDVENDRILAFAIVEAGSQRIQASKVLPGLSIAVLVEALVQSRQLDQSQVGAWLLTQFQAP